MITEHHSKNKWILLLVFGVLFFIGVLFYYISSKQDVSQAVLQNPPAWSAAYISAQSWPPQVHFEAGSDQLNCPETPPESSLPQRTALRKINGRDYCVRALSEGAAGSVYTQYSYSTAVNDGIVTLDFTLRFPRCENYDDPQKTECSNERETFDLDTLVDEMAQNLKFTE